VLGPQALKENAPTQDWTYACFAVAVIVLGWLLPADLLGKHESLRTFCDLVATVVPQIDIITKLGIRPDENRLYYSILWLFSVPFFLVFYISARANFVQGLAKPLSLSKLVAATLFASFGMAFCMFLWYGIGSMSPSQAKTRAVFSYPVVREVAALILVFGFSACLAMLLIVLEQVPKLIRRRSSRA